MAGEEKETRFIFPLKAWTHGAQEEFRNKYGGGWRISLDIITSVPIPFLPLLFVTPSFLPQRFLSIAQVSGSLLDSGDIVVNETDQFLPPRVFPDWHRAIHMLIKKMLIYILGKWWLPAVRGGPAGMTSILTGEFQFPQSMKCHQLFSTFQEGDHLGIWQRQQHTEAVLSLSALAKGSLTPGLIYQTRH